MTHTHCIKKMLGIEDPNINLEETPVVFEKIKQVWTVNTFSDKNNKVPNMI